VRVVLAKGRPARVGDSPFCGAVQGSAPLARLGDWWLPKAWEVETWQVELAGSGILQLAHGAAGWWVEGCWIDAHKDRLSAF